MPRARAHQALTVVVLVGREGLGNVAARGNYIPAKCLVSVQRKLLGNFISLLKGKVFLCVLPGSWPAAQSQSPVADTFP